MPMFDMRRTTVIAAAAWIAAAVAVGRPLAAQGKGATLRGTVRVGRTPRPGVTVNVVNIENQNERQAITEADGTWSVGGLQPGRYEVRVDDAAFRPYKSAVIVLLAGQQRTADIALQAAPPVRTTQRTTPPPQPTGPPPPPPVVVPDYIPSPDRWRLEFPVWQRYPPEATAAHPFVDSSKLGPYKQTVLKGD